MCVKKQRNVLEKCRTGEFFGVCHAGVGEYVYPVTDGDQIAGFVSVSGYTGTDEPNAQKKALHFADKNHIAGQEILEMRAKYLISGIPDKKDIDTLIHPLLFMLEAYLEKNKKPVQKGNDNDLYTELPRYITEHHNCRLTMKLLAQNSNYSISTLSHLFKKHSGIFFVCIQKEVRRVPQAVQSVCLIRNF